MKSMRCLQSTDSTTIPLFLAPAFAEAGISTPSSIRSFSSTACNRARRTRDLNKRRGESVIRSTGPRQRLPVQNVYQELPKPRAEADRPLKEFPMNPNHGLYGFFNVNQESVISGEREEAHGRAWEYHELAFKSFNDLHTIYWQGLLEMNRVKTRMVEHQRLKLGFGLLEIKERLLTVRDTLANIRSVLKDRQDAWEEARLIKEQTQTMAALEEYLNAKEAEAGAARIDIVRDSHSSRVSSVPEDLPTLVRASSVPQESPFPSRGSSVSEDLPYPSRGSSVPEDLPSRDSSVVEEAPTSAKSQGRSTLPPRSNQ